MANNATPTMNYADYLKHLVKRYENAEPLTRAEIETLATELGQWVIEA